MPEGLPGKQPAPSGIGLGFGCAELFRLPSARERRRVLDAAYAAGIEHFDVAPMYGLGLAEPELGAFARTRGDRIAIATKFGIGLTLAARALAPVQGPVRRVLEMRPGMRAAARTSAAGPTSGPMGSLLYRSPGFNSAAARGSLQRSLRALGRDHVDLLLLHDPAPSAVPGDLAACLEEIKSIGLAHAWGVAGEPCDVMAVAGELALTPDVVQVRDDVFHGGGRADQGWRRITFGTLGDAIGRVVSHLHARPRERRRWVDVVDRDVADAEVVAGLLLRDARRRNPSGITLFSTTRPERIAPAVAAATSDAADEQVDAFVALIESELTAPAGAESVR